MQRALVIAAVCACTRIPAPHSEPPRNQTTPFRPTPLAIPNETMEFRARFRGITVATIQTAIGDGGWVDGRHAIIIRSRGRVDGLLAVIGELTWELSTTLDLDHEYPIEDHEEAWAELAGRKTHEDHHHTWEQGEERHDIHSAIGFLRGWHSKHDERAVVQVEVGGGRFGVAIWEAAREFLAAADKPAVRYEGIVDNHDAIHFSFWVSDDAARVPLAFETDTEVGSIAVDLVDYQVASE